MGQYFSLNDYRKRQVPSVVPLSLEGLRTRRAAAPDTTSIIHFVSNAREELGLPFDLSGEASDLRDLVSHYSASGGAFLVIEQDSKLVATAGLRFVSPTVAELTYFLVHAGLRRRGVGRKLFASLLAEARALGFRRIEVETSERFAAPALRSLGLTESPRLPSRPWATIVLSKSL